MNISKCSLIFKYQFPTLVSPMDISDTVNILNCLVLCIAYRTNNVSKAPEFTLGFQWGSFYSIFSFVCMFCRSLFVPLSIFFWPLCCLCFFPLQILITPVYLKLFLKILYVTNQNIGISPYSQFGRLVSKNFTILMILFVSRSHIPYLGLYNAQDFTQILILQTIDI